ncbi:MAG: hypothetical protein KR126chlam1_00862 [Chlamydiae bacterium]|nr:hypothetical protein [Chlamydiota bacterium]
MIHAVTTSQLSAVQPEVMPSQKSPLWGRVNLNWDKVLLFSNTALILAGMAFLYFMKFAFLAIGVGLYGLGSTALYGLALRARVSSDSSHLRKELKLAEAKLKHEQKKVNDAQKDLAAKKSENSKLAAKLTEAQKKSASLSKKLSRAEASKKRSNQRAALARAQNRYGA